MSSEKTLYRKYRPQKFSEVLGQDHITAVLSESIKGGTISHAYLFSGPRGTGKTSVARIFARDLGTADHDLYEIDGASNRGIDDIRELREAVRVHPFDSSYKIYIIDEVHMLTRESFNALLKTLEEPPKHVIFILATTEHAKVPETIVSRCQTFEFKKPTNDTLKKMLVAIAKKEGYELATEGADLIAVIAEGSFRDAQGILQKVLTISKGKKVSRDAIEKITGAPQIELVLSCVKAIVEKDVKEGMDVLSQVRERGIDVSLYLKMVLRALRVVMLLSFAPHMKSALKDEVGEDSFENLEELAKKGNKEELPRTLALLLDAHEQIRFSSIPSLPLELALVEIVGQDSEEFVQ